MENSLTLSMFWDNWDFFRDAVLSGVLAAIMLAVLGVYIVFKRLVFLTAALSQISSAGIALAVWLSFIVFGTAASHADETLTHTQLSWEIIFNPFLIAAILCFGVIIVIGLLEKRSGRDLSGFVAFIYLLGASATLLIGTRIVTEIQDIQQLLLGNAVLVSREDFQIIAAVTAIILLVHFVFRRNFEISTVDADSARVIGIKVGRVQVVLMFTIVASIVVSTKILGALPVFGFSVLPAMAARRLSYNLNSMMIISILLGACAAFFGYILAFLYSLPVGPSQVFVSIVFLSFAYGSHFFWRLLKFKKQSQMN